MVNFIEETEEMLVKIRTEFMEKLDIDEVKIVTMDGEYVQVGGSDIDWDAASEKLGVESWDYNDGYGTQEFMGFITLKDCDVWLERREYDGSEWWQVVRKPKIRSM